MVFKLTEQKLKPKWKKNGRDSTSEMNHLPVIEQLNTSNLYFLRVDLFSFLMPLNLGVKMHIKKVAAIQKEIIKMRQINELYGQPHSRNNEAHKLSFATYIHILNQPRT